MSSATVLPVRITPMLAEAVYKRAQFAQQCVVQNTRNAQAARDWARRGVRAAAGKDRYMMRLLELAAEELRKLNDDQQARLTAQDLRKQDFAQFATWKEAYVLAANGNAEAAGAQLEIFQYIYGAALEGATRGRVDTRASFT